MRTYLRAALVFMVLAAGAVGAATPPISSEALLEHIKFLASDDLQGRASGTEGLEKAADYIAAEFMAAGLRPGGEGGGWYQPFGLTTGLSIDPGNTLIVRTGTQSVRLTIGESYYPLAATPVAGNQTPIDLKDVPLVFAGYGLSAPGANYDDYAGLDVKGKAVVILSHEPQETHRDSRLNGARPMRETTLDAKALAARSRGARVLLVVSDPSHRTDPVNYGTFEIDSDPEDHQIPVLRVRRETLAPLLAAWGVDEIATAIDRDLMPRSRLLANTSIDYAERLSVRRRTVRNVVGILDGSGASRGQAVVLGAHYDHVGLGGRFSAAPDRTGEIHNGADDNASGVASVIEIARAAAADRLRFPRTLVFIAFAGEERGLLGSVQYTIDPALPLSDTVAMINLDMVGRSNGKVEVGGLNESPALADDVEAAAKIVGIKVLRGGPGAGRSDDSSFVDRHIPAVHFFTGFHEDYHRPSDDWNRIDAAGTARVATLALELAARLASDPNPTSNAR